MSNTFYIGSVEYMISKDNLKRKPILTRVDGHSIDNRKEVCRQFLRLQGWSESMFGDMTTNELESKINKIVNSFSYKPSGNKEVLKEKEIGDHQHLNIIERSKVNNNLIDQKEENKPSINKSNIGYYNRLSSKIRKDIPTPNIKEVEYWLNEWINLEDYSAQEAAINVVFNDYKTNDKLENIMIKACLLNDFYSTNIRKIYPVAKHILNLNIDERLKEGDPTLVNDIAVVKFNNNTINFYSFASKYCSHHNELEFPIYDSYVHKVLVYFRDVNRFYQFDESDLKNYPRFKNILLQFRKYYGLEKFNLKELDEFLWQFGKKYFPKNYDKVLKAI